MMKPMLIKKIWTTFLIPTYSVLLSPNIRIDLLTQFFFILRGESYYFNHSYA